MISDEDVNDFLAHYGVLGMRWGVRRSQSQLDRASGKGVLDDVPRSTRRNARKDANESAKAKMFYGEGAGTRRKLIKAKVETRSKDPGYKKAFDHFSSTQNMEKRASQAKRTRKAKDAKAGVAKTARGIKNLALNTGAPVTLAAVAAFAAWKVPAVRSVVTKTASTTFNTVKNSSALKNGVEFLKNLR